MQCSAWQASATLTTQLGDKQFPVFYYDQTAAIEEDMCRCTGIDCTHRDAKVASEQVDGGSGVPADGGYVVGGNRGDGGDPRIGIQAVPPANQAE